jgi:hypothetical protein
MTPEDFPRSFRSSFRSCDVRASISDPLGEKNLDDSTGTASRAAP